MEKSGGMAQQIQVIASIIELGEKAEKYDELVGKGIAGKPSDSDDDPAIPSGMKAPYSKSPGKKRRKKPGRKKGHLGASRPKPERIDHFKEHTLSRCPDCDNEPGDPVKSHNAPEQIEGRGKDPGHPDDSVQVGFIAKAKPGGGLVGAG